MQSLSDKTDKDVKSAVVEILSSSVSAAASTSTAVVAGVPGKKIVVVYTHLNVHDGSPTLGFPAPGVSIVVKSSSTSLTGEYIDMDLCEYTDYNPDGHYKTADGEGLVITLKNTSGSSSNLHCNGWINYYEE